MRAGRLPLGSSWWTSRAAQRRGTARRSAPPSAAGPCHSPPCASPSCSQQSRTHLRKREVVAYLHRFDDAEAQRRAACGGLSGRRSAHLPHQTTTGRGGGGEAGRLATALPRAQAVTSSPLRARTPQHARAQRPSNKHGPAAPTRAAAPLSGAHSTCRPTTTVARTAAAARRQRRPPTHPPGRGSCGGAALAAGGGARVAAARATTQAPPPEARTPAASEAAASAAVTRRRRRQQSAPHGRRQWQQRRRLHCHLRRNGASARRLRLPALPSSAHRAGSESGSAARRPRQGQ